MPARLQRSRRHHGQSLERPQEPHVFCRRVRLARVPVPDWAPQIEQWVCVGFAAVSPRQDGIGSGSRVRLHMREVRSALRNVTPIRAFRSICRFGLEAAMRRRSDTMLGSLLKTSHSRTLDTITSSDTGLTLGSGGLDGGPTMPRIQLPATKPKRTPWNKGRLVGQKRPLLPKQVWAIRARLELAGHLRDLALFNLAIDSKLRGCDLVRLKVTDLVIGGRVRERVSVVQSKTGRPVQFEVSENTRNSVMEWVNAPEMRGCGLPVSEPVPRVTASVDAPIRPACPRLGVGNWSRPEWLRDTLIATDEGRVDLPEDWQSACGPIAARPHESRQHRPISRCRTGGRVEHR